MVKVHDRRAILSTTITNSLQQENNIMELVMVRRDNEELDMKQTCSMRMARASLVPRSFFHQVTPFLFPVHTFIIESKSGVFFSALTVYA
jgi:hypothetical protein